MPEARDCGAARAKPELSRRKALTATHAAPAVGAAMTSRAATGTSRKDAIAQPIPDAELLALLVILKQQNHTITAIEEDAHPRPEGITVASRARERRLRRVLDRRAATLDRVITMQASTPADLRVKAEALRLAAMEYGLLREGETVEHVSEHAGALDRLALSLARDVMATRCARGSRTR
jgi:hypothetical protein